MKKLYNFLGFAGFITMLCATGLNENVDFGTVLFTMSAGITMILISMLLTKMHDIRVRRKRRQYLFAKRHHTSKSTASAIVQTERKVPAGIALIIEEKLKSAKLC